MASACWSVGGQLYLNLLTVPKAMYWFLRILLMLFKPSMRLHGAKWLDVWLMKLKTH